MPRVRRFCGSASTTSANYIAKLWNAVGGTDSSMLAGLFRVRRGLGQHRPHALYRLKNAACRSSADGHRPHDDGPQHRRPFSLPGSGCGRICRGHSGSDEDSRPHSEVRATPRGQRAAARTTRLRRKQGFSFPLAFWFRHELRESTIRCLRDGSLVSHDYFAPTP